GRFNRPDDRSQLCWYGVAVRDCAHRRHRMRGARPVTVRGSRPALAELGDGLVIVVFGSLNVDLTVPVTHLPEPGETVLGPGYQMVPGGKGANQALAAARAGGK